MSEEQLKAFWEAIHADAGLQQKLQGVTEPGAVAAIAKEAGFSISAEEIKKAQSVGVFIDDLLNDSEACGCFSGVFICSVA
jgi:predicted ribosomally synthesized peptide with nif11-like leader